MARCAAMATGVMPLMCCLPLLPCSKRWPPVWSFCPPPWWRRWEDDGSGISSSNKHAGAPDRDTQVISFLSSCCHGGGEGGGGRSLRGFVFWCATPSDERFWRGGSLPRIWWRTSSSPALVAVTVVVELLRWIHWKLDDADGVREHRRRWIWRSAGAHAGRWPASSDEPLYPLAEWRHSSFLPASMPKGRQYYFWIESMAWCHGDLGGPSGHVPGTGEMNSFGPDGNLVSMFEVLFVSFRDLFVISCLCWVLM